LRSGGIGPGDHAAPQCTAVQAAILRDAACGGSSERVNLSIFAIFDMSQIKDLA
jgi:hypothetical protein